MGPDHLSWSRSWHLGLCWRKAPLEAAAKKLLDCSSAFFHLQVQAQYEAGTLELERELAARAALEAQLGQATAAVEELRSVAAGLQADKDALLEDLAQLADAAEQARPPAPRPHRSSADEAPTWLTGLLQHGLLSHASAQRLGQGGPAGLQARAAGLRAARLNIQDTGPDPRPCLPAHTRPACAASPHPPPSSAALAATWQAGPGTCGLSTPATDSPMHAPQACGCVQMGAVRAHRDELLEAASKQATEVRLLQSQVGPCRP